MNEALLDRLLPLTGNYQDNFQLNYLNRKRKLDSGAKVTRFAPSPTGFMHLGGVYISLINKVMALQSNGVFFLRIEDTDTIRSDSSMIQVISEMLSSFMLSPDEGVINSITDGYEQIGEFGPYIQSERKHIYHVFVRDLIKRGFAYPCFLTKVELEEIKLKQGIQKKRPGCYGEFAVWRDAKESDIHKKLDEGISFVIRMKSRGDNYKQIIWHDLVKGEIQMPENDTDVVLLKSDAFPTYHFAHVVDDYLMGTTHVIRGDEWLSSVPLHLEIFEAFGWKPPLYAHISPIEKEEKIEGGRISRRKLSKRKDPEANILYYLQQGFPVSAIIKYLLNLMDSSYLLWQSLHPEEHFRNFTFLIEKFSKHGALHDLNKLKSISQDVISDMDNDTIYIDLYEWACRWDVDLASVMKLYPDYTKQILNIERDGARPSKRFTTWRDVGPQIRFMYDEFFSEAEISSIPKMVSLVDASGIVKSFIENYRENIDKVSWVTLLKKISVKFNYAESVSDYKKYPEKYKGHIGDVAMLLRLGVCGVTHTPDLREIMNLLGHDRVICRLKKLCERFGVGFSC